MLSVPGKKTISCLAVGATLLLAVLTPVAAPAAPPPVNFVCSPTKVKGVVAEVIAATSSPSFVVIANTSVSFAQGGASASCVIVRFSAEAFAVAPNRSISVRAILDDITPGSPTEVRYAMADAVGSTAHSFEFVFPSVAPGVHFVRMQFYSTNGNTSVGKRTTIVQFAP